jgi:ubiquinone/menaquinone biosynthesis C-methylase UbiE
MNGEISGRDAEIYLSAVHKHGLDKDIRFIRKYARFPVGSSVLDVGFGSAELLKFLHDEKGYNRKLFGIEKSPDLFNIISKKIELCSINLLLGDFLDINTSDLCGMDQIVMSFYLHHQECHRSHIKKAFEVLRPGGKLFIYDRILDLDEYRNDFTRFWYDKYLQEHEWSEDIPNLLSHENMLALAQEIGFIVISHESADHDSRIETRNFKKKIYELWSIGNIANVSACFLIHPMYINLLDKILGDIMMDYCGSFTCDFNDVVYSGDLIKDVYPGLPWTDLLSEWTDEIYKGEVGRLIILKSNDHWAKILHHLGIAKRKIRKKYGVCLGPRAASGDYMAMYNAFHVPEPWELVDFLRLIRCHLV